MWSPITKPSRISRSVEAPKSWISWPTTKNVAGTCSRSSTSRICGRVRSRAVVERERHVLALRGAFFARTACRRAPSSRLSLRARARPRAAVRAPRHAGASGCPPRRSRRLRVSPTAPRSARRRAPRSPPARRAGGGECARAGHPGRAAAVSGRAPWARRRPCARPAARLRSPSSSAGSWTDARQPRRRPGRLRSDLAMVAVCRTSAAGSCFPLAGTEAAGLSRRIGSADEPGDAMPSAELFGRITKCTSQQRPTTRCAP